MSLLKGRLAYCGSSSTDRRKSLFLHKLLMKTSFLSILWAALMSLFHITLISQHCLQVRMENWKYFQERGRTSILLQGGLRFFYRLKSSSSLAPQKARKKTNTYRAQQLAKLGTSCVIIEAITQALFLCNICVVFKAIFTFGNLRFIHASTNATDDHKYSPLPSADFDIAKVLV